MMFIILLFIPLYNKIRIKQIIRNSQGNLGGPAICKDMDDKIIISEGDRERAVKREEGRPQTYPRPGRQQACTASGWQRMSAAVHIPGPGCTGTQEAKG